MQIKIIDHSFHQHTKSSQFFIDILQKFGTVHISWDESWKLEGIETDLSDVEAYDLVVVFQMEHVAIKAAKLGLKNLLFIPMYDGAKLLSPFQWKSLNSIKILNFSSYLHEQIQRYGNKNSSYFQYFLNPQFFPEVTDFSNIRGFLWQRHRKPSWNEVKKLLGSKKLDSFKLHCALDPAQGDAILPSVEDREFYNVQTSTWFEKKSELYDLLIKSNLYFSPRLDEGIGMSFLEALSMGMPVVANDSPTMNEYIVDGVNGFLYEVDKINALPLNDTNRLKIMGQRAREIAFYGYERWMGDQERLFDFLKEPTNTIDSTKLYFSAPPKPLSFDDEIPSKEALMKFQGGTRLEGANYIRPKITVATVVRNARQDLMVTLSSILKQDMNNIEVIVIDGGSDDGTLTDLRALDDNLDYWESFKDDGPYYAMNRAASLANGEWIIFINAGDYFCSNQSLRQLFGTPPDDVDFIVGHHIYYDADGVESVHRVRCFENTWSELTKGSLSGKWLTGIPGHQATITRTQLLKNNRYDTNFKITADHDFMYRMREKGRKFYISPVIASYYRGGGLSWQNLEKCIEEWILTCKKHTKNPTGVSNFFLPMLAANFFAFAGLKRYRHWFVFFRKYPKIFIRMRARETYKVLLKLMRRKIIPVQKSQFDLDFSNEGIQKVYTQLEGFAIHESWGCWTDGEKVTISLGHTFVGSVILSLYCPYVFLPTLRNGAYISIGDIKIPITTYRSKLALNIQINLSQPASILYIHFKNPVSPSEINQSADFRKLGLGIKHMKLREVK